MGCPDWPRCFGRVIPPTHESELPPDYQVKYKDHGYGTVKFDPVKTWIEYINRLLGASLGLLVLSLFGFSFIYRKKDNIVILLCGFVLLLVIIEGLIGKYVVATNLKPITVSIHMWGSIFIILLLIYTISRIKKEKLSVAISQVAQLKTWVYALMILTTVQIILGTSVRQDVDIIAASMSNGGRELWIEKLGKVFYIHRSFSIIILVAHFYFIYKLRKCARENNLIVKSGYVLVGLIILESILGIILGYFNLPALIQPIHMLLSSMILSSQFFILILLLFSKDKQEVYNI
jgi:cytochrome c oxidase assembly protein subunit 15